MELIQNIDSKNEIPLLNLPRSDIYKSTKFFKIYGKNRDWSGRGVGGHRRPLSAARPPVNNTELILRSGFRNPAGPLIID